VSILGTRPVHAYLGARNIKTKDSQKERGGGKGKGDAGEAYTCIRDVYGVKTLSSKRLNF